MGKVIILLILAIIGAANAATLGFDDYEYDHDLDHDLDLKDLDLKDLDLKDLDLKDLDLKHRDLKHLDLKESTEGSTQKTYSDIPVEIMMNGHREEDKNMSREESSKTGHDEISAVKLKDDEKMEKKPRSLNEIENSEEYWKTAGGKDLMINMYQIVKDMNENVIKLTKASEKRNEEMANLVYRQADDSAAMIRLQCPTNFTVLGDGCYYFNDYDLKDWEAAQKICSKMAPQAHLATVESRQEWDTIRNYLTENNLVNKNWWLGGSDREEEGQFRWVGTNKEVDFGDWCQQEPNNYAGKEDCIMIAGVTEGFNADRRLCWNDFACIQCPFLKLPIHFICEVKRN